MGSFTFGSPTPHHIKNVKIYSQHILNQVNNFSYQINLKDYYNFDFNRLLNWFICL